MFERVECTFMTVSGTAPSLPPPQTGRNASISVSCKCNFRLKIIHLIFIGPFCANNVKFLCQIVLGLRYIHKEKFIVHRDLTPNNIMLGENDKVTISKTSALDSVLFCCCRCLRCSTEGIIGFVLNFAADFGLAKQKNPEASKMTSMVGTILYSW